VRKSDLFDINSIKQSLKDVQTGPKWFWKVLENAHKKVIKSRGKPLLVICAHPVEQINNFAIIIVVVLLLVHMVLICCAFCSLWICWLWR